MTPAVVAPSPVEAAIARVEAALGGRMVHCVRIAPAAGGGGGPVDAVRIAPDAAVVPHSRCWLAWTAVACPARDLDAARLQLQQHPRLLLTPPDLGLTDTAVLMEWFRDMGRGNEFSETVVFSHSMRHEEGVLTTWLAASRAAGGVGL